LKREVRATRTEIEKQKKKTKQQQQQQQQRTVRVMAKQDKTSNGEWEPERGYEERHTCFEAMVKNHEEPPTKATKKKKEGQICSKWMWIERNKPSTKAEEEGGEGDDGSKP
jgi:hypothetical protein